MREGWEVCELQKHIKLIDYRGRTPKKTDSGIKLITAKNVKLGYLQEHPEEFIAEDNYEDWMRRGIPEYGDVIFTTEAPLANVAQLLTHEKVAFAQRTIVMQPESEILDKTFLKFLLLSPQIRDDIFSNGTGATVTGIKSSLLKKIQIPIPPLTEQKQIVAILDQAFAAIDQAKANIEKNIQNAKELFQSKLNTTFESIVETKKLGDILELLTDYHANGSYKVLKENVELKDEEDYAWMVRSTDFEKGFKKGFKYIDEHAYNHLKKSKIYGGEIIISKIGNAGKVYVMPEIDRPCSLAMNLFLLRLKRDQMGSKYLYHYLQSTKGEKQILSKLNGTATKTITKDSVRNLNIPFVNITTQNNEVDKLEGLMETSSRLEFSYQQKIRSLDELKKSILQKAFAGELTAKGGVI